jgi:hypothetical protein
MEECRGYLDVYMHLAAWLPTAQSVLRFCCASLRKRLARDIDLVAESNLEGAWGADADAQWSVRSVWTFPSLC